MGSSSSPILRVEHLRHSRAGDPGGWALEVPALEIELRTFTVLDGAPGSGAGLLLRLLGLLERPHAGEIFFADMGTSGLDDPSRLELRNHAFGFIFAEPFLLDAFSVAENIAMPLFKISGLDLEQARQRALELLEFAGLLDTADDPVGELNPLQQQKLALARSLASAPQVLIVEDAAAQLPEADRPEFFANLRAARDWYGIAVIARASRAVAGADRSVRIEDGRIVDAPAEEARAHE